MLLAPSDDSLVSLDEPFSMDGSSVYGGTKRPIVSATRMLYSSAVAGDLRRNILPICDHVSYFWADLTTTEGMMTVGRGRGRRSADRRMSPRYRSVRSYWRWLPNMRVNRLRDGRKGRDCFGWRAS